MNRGLVFSLVIVIVGAVVNFFIFYLSTSAAIGKPEADFLKIVFIITTLLQIAVSLWALLKKV